MQSKKKELHKTKLQHLKATKKELNKKEIGALVEEEETRFKNELTKEDKELPFKLSLARLEKIHSLALANLKDLNRWYIISKTNDYFETMKMLLIEEEKQANKLLIETQKIDEEECLKKAEQSNISLFNKNNLERSQMQIQIRLQAKLDLQALSQDLRHEQIQFQLFKRQRQKQFLRKQKLTEKNNQAMPKSQLSKLLSDNKLAFEKEMEQIEKEFVENQEKTKKDHLEQTEKHSKYLEERLKEKQSERQVERLTEQQMVRSELLQLHEKQKETLKQRFKYMFAKLQQQKELKLQEMTLDAERQESQLKFQQEEEILEEENKFKLEMLHLELTLQKLPKQEVEPKIEALKAQLEKDFIQKKQLHQTALKEIKSNHEILIQDLKRKQEAELPTENSFNVSSSVYPLVRSSSSVSSITKQVRQARSVSQPPHLAFNPDDEMEDNSTDSIHPVSSTTSLGRNNLFSRRRSQSTLPDHLNNT